MPPSDALDAQLLAAHAADDRAALVGLYQRAGDMALNEGRDVAGWFYLTHAYVFALELGDARAAELRRRLVAAGREG